MNRLQHYHSASPSYIPPSLNPTLEGASTPALVVSEPCLLVDIHHWTWLDYHLQKSPLICSGRLLTLSFAEHSPFPHQLSGEVEIRPTDEYSPAFSNIRCLTRRTMDVHVKAVRIIQPEQSLSIPVNVRRFRRSIMNKASAKLLESPNEGDATVALLVNVRNIPQEVPPYPKQSIEDFQVLQQTQSISKIWSPKPERSKPHSSW